VRRKVLIGIALLVVGTMALFLWRVQAMDYCLSNNGIWDVNNGKCVCTPGELAAPPNRDYATYCKAVPAP